MNRSTGKIGRVPVVYTRLAWLVVAVAFVCSQGATGDPNTRRVGFTRERIAVQVDSGSMVIDGIYVLTNATPHDMVAPLFYPFPVDSTHPFPDSISVWLRKEPVPFGRSGDGIVFSVPVPAGNSSAFRVVYRQKCLDGTGCYILTTTSVWHRPLERADFEITIADGLELLWSAYELSPVDNEDGVRTYGFTREAFMPERDLCLRWAARAASDTSP